ncbi:hypothetical protein HDV02_000651, partial [Globomyces sp. JEL0801]
MLGELIPELIQQIAYHLSVYDIQQLIQCNHHLRNSISSQYFGKKYMEGQSKELKYYIDINLIEITIEDQVFLLKTNELDFAIVIFNPDQTLLFQYHINLYGNLKIKTKQILSDRFDCQLIKEFKSSKRDHSYQKCRFCQYFGIVNTLLWVDKTFLVFYKDWNDEYAFDMNHIRVYFRLSGQHYQISSYGESCRYDLKIFTDNIGCLRRLWDD